MSYRDYGGRGRGWDRDWNEEERYGRGGPSGRGYYGGGPMEEENWDRWGRSRDYGESSYDRDFERGEPRPEDRSRGRAMGGGGVLGRGAGFGRAPYYGGGYESGGGLFGGRISTPYYGTYDTLGDPYYGGSWGTSRRDLGRTDIAEGRRGNFAGRGPKGWKRSDERIRDDVSEALARHPHIDASELEVRVENAVVTLIGVVEDRREKRLVEDIAEDVFGVDDINNELKIRHGFLAGLTGEKANDRELARGTERDATGTTTGARTTGARATTGRTTTASTR